MRVITVTTIVETIFQIPDDLSIEAIRYQVMPEICDDEECTEPMRRLHEQAINKIYMGDAICHSQSVETKIVEVD